MGMTYESIVEAARNKFYNVDVSSVAGTRAFQINIEGKAVNGIFYIEIKDGKVNVEPYEYYDRNAIIQKLNEMDRYVSTELRLCDTDKKFPQNEVFIVDDVYEMIEQLPPVQPEIIYCKDCKWYGRADKRRFYRGMDCLKKRIDTIVPDRDFCSKAERRMNATD